MGDDFEYATSVEGNIAVLRAIECIYFRKKLRQIMPLITKELVAAGVDFSKVNFTNVIELTNDDLNAVFEDLR